MKLSVLTLGAALMLGGVTPVAAQNGIPALPARPAPSPAHTPSPAHSPSAAPEATPSSEAVKQQPDAPTLESAGASGPLLITVRTQIPALIKGKKTTTDFIRTLSISADRATEIRRAKAVTPSFDNELNRFFDALGKVGQDARFMQLEDGTWAVVQRNNLVIDREATRANVLALIGNPRSAQAEVVVKAQTPPQRTLDFFASKGVTSFLASGQTSYSGSSADRITNIHVGAGNFQDRLLGGKTFSFNQTVGPITARNGYVTGLVIAGDQTASGVGGGICQVSTTVFRALYGAGLPVIQRQNHSYQVHYYDPQGLDASVYQPSLDLKFANDTGKPLWFQTEWDDKDLVLTVNVFGAAPKYDVVIGTPKTLSSTPSPKDRLIYDRALAAGKRQQVDWAAPGAVIEVTRKFMQGGKEAKHDILQSRYRPWPNIFRVGTKK